MGTNTPTVTATISCSSPPFDEGGGGSVVPVGGSLVSGGDGSSVAVGVSVLGGSLVSGGDGSSVPVGVSVVGGSLVSGGDGSSVAVGVSVVGGDGSSVAVGVSVVGGSVLQPVTAPNDTLTSGELTPGYRIETVDTKTGNVSMGCVNFACTCNFSCPDGSVANAAEALKACITPEKLLTNTSVTALETPVVASRHAVSMLMSSCRVVILPGVHATDEALTLALIG